MLCELTVSLKMEALFPPKREIYMYLNVYTASLPRTASGSVLKQSMDSSFILSNSQAFVISHLTLQVFNACI